jgi:hypothetical protein
MTGYSDYKRQLRQEAKAERIAAIAVGSTSFADILRFNKLELEYPTTKTDKVGNVIKVRGQDINDSSTWQKFLAHVGKINADIMSLANDVEPLTEAYDTFLATSHTERYRNLDVPGQRWRRAVVRLAVTYHIMENKLDGYLQGVEDAFVDERVGYYYTLVRQIRTAMAGAARAINHIIKDKEESQKYLSDFFTAHYEQFRVIPFPQRDDILRLIAPDEDIAI